MHSREDAVAALMKYLSGDRYVSGIELIVHGHPRADVEMSAHVEAIAEARPKSNKVPICALVRLVEIVANPRIIAVGTHEQPAYGSQKEIVKLKSHAPGILSKTAVAWEAEADPTAYALKATTRFSVTDCLFLEGHRGRFPNSYLPPGC